MIRAILIALVTIALGWGGATWYQRQNLAKRQNQLHGRIATLRTYQEGYALRHGAYLGLSDSCQGPDANWAKLGMTPPEKTVGCFKAEPLFADGATRPTGVRIVAVSPSGDLTGVETTDDRQPTWTLADGKAPLK